MRAAAFLMAALGAALALAPASAALPYLPALGAQPYLPAPGAPQVHDPGPVPSAPGGPQPLAAPVPQPLTWFLTGARGDVPSHEITNVLLMEPQQAGTASQVTFSSVPLPPAGGPQRVESITWHWPGSWPLETEIAGDATVVLFFDASVPTGVGNVRIELQALPAEGGVVTLGTSEESIPIGQAGETRIGLPVLDTAPEGSTVRLTVRLDGAGVATVLSFDSAEAPSRIEAMFRPLDSDSDGVPDTLERRGGTDPLDAREPADGAFDTDSDGLPDAREAVVGTDPLRADSDSDGWNDGTEVQAGTDPANGADRPPDADGDGMFDGFEARAGTLANLRDSNGDGLDDCLEDPDGDNLTHCQEQAWGSDPQRADTDGDGIDDGTEVVAGTDPTLHGRPRPGPQPQAAELAVATVFLGAGSALALVGLTRRHRL